MKYNHISWNISRELNTIFSVPWNISFGPIQSQIRDLIQKVTDNPW